MKGCWGLKEAAHAAEMACHNTRWIKEHGGRGGRFMRRLYISPLSVYTSQGDFGRFVSRLIKKFHLSLEKWQSWCTLFKKVCNLIKCGFSCTLEFKGLCVLHPKCASGHLTASASAFMHTEIRNRACVRQFLVSSLWRKKVEFSCNYQNSKFTQFMQKSICTIDFCPFLQQFLFCVAGHMKVQTKLISHNNFLQFGLSGSRLSQVSALKTVCYRSGFWFLDE